MTNTARSGSYLISMMMSANPELMVASEPYLELFRSYRNAVVRENARSDFADQFDPASPMQDYYFTEDHRYAKNLVQQATLDIPYDDSEWEGYLEKAVPRVSLQCAELAPLMPEMKSDDYRGMFDKGFELIKRTRDTSHCKWVGIKDAWIIEFFAPLAKAYPDAKFITILRDPRAMVNSMLGVVNEDPLQVAQVLSYARHWRKYVAYMTYFQTLPLFKDRLYFVTHEQVLSDPEGKSRDICEFLEVDYVPQMIDTESFHDYATGKVWNGNSSFESSTKGISKHRAERWKTKLSPEIIKTVDFLCGPEMRLAGFEPMNDVTGHDTDVLNYLISANKEYMNWRSDIGEIQQDYGFELFRHSLLQAGTIDDAEMLEKCFLFPEVYHAALNACQHRAAA